MSDRIPGLVSTIIPAYNRPAMLREAVASVLAQTYRPVEIILSDDGSTDGTGAAADELAAAHPDVIRAVHNPNRGPGPAREAGRLLARGEFIQYLDSDDLLWPRKFEVQVEALRRQPGCGAAYGYIRQVREGQPPGTAPYKWTGRALPTLFPWLLVDRWWNTPCPLFRRSLCDAVGPWSDLRFSQDWEYDGRIGALGTRLAHCPEFVVDYRCHSAGRQTGTGRWLAPADRVRFFSLLYGHACRAGVAAGAPEMRHFSRWVFLHARQLGQQGSPREARQCFELAVRATGAADGTMRAYRALARVVGWALAGRLTTSAIALAGRRPGRHTLAQSGDAPAPSTL